MKFQLNSLSISSSKSLNYLFLIMYSSFVAACSSSSTGSITKTDTTSPPKSIVEILNSIKMTLETNMIVSKGKSYWKDDGQTLVNDWEEGGVTFDNCVLKFENPYHLFPRSRKRYTLLFSQAKVDEIEYNQTVTMLFKSWQPSIIYRQKGRFASDEHDFTKNYSVAIYGGPYEIDLSKVISIHQFSYEGYNSIGFRTPDVKYYDRENYYVYENYRGALWHPKRLFDILKSSRTLSSDYRWDLVKNGHKGMIFKGLDGLVPTLVTQFENAVKICNPAYKSE